MPTLYGTNYCGPFNKMGKAVRSKVDALCKTHDEDYQQIIDKGGNPYFSHNWADKKFLNALSQLDEWDWQSALAYVLFRGKSEMLPGDTGSSKRQALLTDLFPQAKTKRLKVDGPDLPFNVPAIDLPQNIIVPYIQAAEHNQLMSFPSSHSINGEHLPGMYSSGPFVPVPKNYQKGHKFHFREVGQFTTTKDAQVNTGEFAIINNADLKYCVANVPIRYYDESGVPGVATMKTSSINLTPVSTFEYSNPGELKFHFDIEWTFYIKNNSTTEARVHFKEINYITSDNDLWANSISEAMAIAYETPTPEVGGVSTAFTVDPKHDMLNWHPSEKGKWKYGVGKYYYLKPGQSTALHAKWSFISDNPYGSALTEWSVIKGCKSIAYRISGDIGHNGTNVALVPVNALDWERETKINVHISHGTYKGKINTAQELAIYRTANVASINVENP